MKIEISKAELEEVLDMVEKFLANLGVKNAKHVVNTLYHSSGGGTGASGTIDLGNERFPSIQHQREASERVSLYDDLYPIKNNWEE